MRSGIYTITNVLNSKVYLGRSVDVYRRLKEHERNLLDNKHVNRHLQASFNLHPEAFKFEVLDLYPEELLPDMETYWLNMTQAYDRNFGYCIDQSGYNGTIKMSEESKEILRQKAVGRKQSPETIRKRVDKLKGQKRPTQSLKMKERWNTTKAYFGWNSLTEEQRKESARKIGLATRDRYKKRAK